MSIRTHFQLPYLSLSATLITITIGTIITTVPHSSFGVPDADVNLSAGVDYIGFSSFVFGVRLQTIQHEMSTRTRCFSSKVSAKTFSHKPQC